MEELIGMAAELIFGMVSLIVACFLVPWLKEKRLLSIVRKAVEAAEKLSEHESFDKKEYVRRVLRCAGVKLNETVEAMIEGCVLELDLLISNIKDPETDKDGDYNY